MERTELTAKIEEKYKKMSKGHKRIADYIRQNYDKAAFMTANKLGGRLGLGEQQWFGLAARWGFDGYRSLQEASKVVIPNRLTTLNLIAASITLLEPHETE